MERKPVVIAQEALEKEAAVCEQIKALWASRGRTPRAFVDTYGCQQNEADSERIRGMLRASGYEIVDTEEGADCIVINTCAIREHAETRVYGNVGALVHTKARHPEQKIFLCGCMMGQPQVVDRIKNSYRHVDGVFNPHELWRFPEKGPIVYVQAELPLQARPVVSGQPADDLIHLLPGAALPLRFGRQQWIYLRQLHGEYFFLFHIIPPPPFSRVSPARWHIVQRPPFIPRGSSALLSCPL